MTRWRWVLLGVLGVALAVWLVGLVSLPDVPVGDPDVAAPAPVTIERLPSPAATTPTPSVEAPPEPLPSAAPAPAALPPPVSAATTSVDSMSLEIPSIGLRARVEPLDAGPEGLRPPRIDRLYWWRARGVPGPGATDTIFVTGHSVRDPAVAGVLERLQDVSAGDRVTLQVGDSRSTYTVSRTWTVPKAQIVQDGDLFAVVPGRLVIVGCLLRPDGRPQTDNVVVLAALQQ